jgi:hypothetical protein
MYAYIRIWYTVYQYYIYKASNNENLKNTMLISNFSHKT